MLAEPQMNPAIESKEVDAFSKEVVTDNSVSQATKQVYNGAGDSLAYSQ